MPARILPVLCALAGLVVFLAGCTTSSRSTAHAPEPLTTALLIVAENSSLTSGQLATERERVIAYLRSREVLSATDVLVGDLATADRIIRVVVGADGGYKISYFGDNRQLAWAPSRSAAPSVTDDRYLSSVPYAFGFLGAGYLYYDYGWPYFDHWHRYGSSPYGPGYPGYAYRPPPVVVVPPPPAKPDRPHGPRPDKPDRPPKSPDVAGHPGHPHPRPPQAGPDGRPDRPHRPDVTPRPGRGNNAPDGRRDWSRNAGDHRPGGNPDRSRGQPPRAPVPRPSPKTETPRPIVTPMTRPVVTPMAPPATFTPPPPPSPPPSIPRGDTDSARRVLN